LQTSISREELASLPIRRYEGEVRLLDSAERLAHEAAAIRRDDLNQVAHGRSIDRLQKFELGSAWRGHSMSPLGVKKGP